MLSEFVDRLAKLGRESAEAKVIEIEGIDTRVLVQHGDKLIEKEIPPPRVEARLLSRDSLVRLVKTLPDPEVFVAPHLIHVWCNRVDRRDSVSLGLTLSDRFMTVDSLAKAHQFAPNDAVKLLRFDLDASGAGVDTLRKALSRVDFSRTSGARFSAEHGKETLGRAVEAEVQGVGDVPDSISVSVPLWAVIGFPQIVTVKIGVYLDVMTHQVELRTLPDQIKPAVDKAVVDVVSNLAEELPEVPIYCGQP